MLPMAVRVPTMDTAHHSFIVPTVLTTMPRLSIKKLIGSQRGTSRSGRRLTCITNMAAVQTTAPPVPSRPSHSPNVS
jgi:hypothetical protein